MLFNFENLIKGKSNHVASEIEFKKDTILKILSKFDCTSTLCDEEEIKFSSQLIDSLNLPYHHDINKNWDTLKALLMVQKYCKKDSVIMDVGSGSESMILNWLYELGYNKLIALDRLDKSKTENFSKKNINFIHGDLVKTTMENESVDFAISISALEHGAVPEDFFKEMHRILRPGGTLFVSTDYWPTPIDCTGIYPYGEKYGEMHVFTKNRIIELIEYSNKIGLKNIGNFSPKDLDAEKKIIHWKRVDRRYTFTAMTFQKM